MTLFPTHSMRWLERGDVRVLQQLFTDQYGKHHWIDVPTVRETP